MPTNYVWSPITDLPADYANLTDGELAALTEVWKEQREELADTEALKTFQTQLHRRWAIETGVIEGAYSLDRGVTETLIIEGIDANLIRSGSTNKDPDEVAAMIEDHLSVLEQLFSFVAGGRDLSVSYIKELHAALLRHVPTHTVRDAVGNLSERELVKGAFKSLPNNPSRPDGSVHQYCPPEHVDAEMDNLIRLLGEHKNFPPEIEAAWLHHRFTQIHPFADGNGRVARAIASAVLLRAGLFPLVITRDNATAYIRALEQADLGDLGHLVRHFISVQRRAVMDAVHAIPSVRENLAPEFESVQPQTVEEQIGAARMKLVLGDQVILGKKEWNRASRLATGVRETVARRLTQVTLLLRSQLTEQKVWSFRVDKEALLLERTGVEIRIFCSARELGPSFRGFCIAQTLYTQKGQAPICLDDEPFQINYKESHQSIQARFVPWFEAGLARGLALWREQL